MYKLTRVSERAEEMLAWPTEGLERTECRLLTDWLAEIMILIPRTLSCVIKDVSYCLKS